MYCGTHGINFLKLCIQVEVHTGEEEGWQEEVVYWEGPKYKLYTERKTWADAEAHCQMEGSHLASVVTDVEQEEVRAAAGGNSVWLGATYSETYSKEEGIWRWTDGSPLGYHNWRAGSGNMGDCAIVYQPDDYQWIDTSCTSRFNFLCQFPPTRVLAGSQSLTLEYMKQDLTFPFINILYRYKANQQLLASWEDKRMTGFKLSWFLQDNNGSSLTEIQPSVNCTAIFSFLCQSETQNMTQDWKPEAASPAYQEQQLLSMVLLATQARIQNVGWEEVINRTILEKAKLIQNGQLHYTSMCFEGQIKPNHHSVIVGLNIGVNSTTGDVATDEDLLTGFMMFSTMIYCSESVPLYQFLQGLLSTQSPRTIIQATVNTIQSGDIKEMSDTKRMGRLYLALDKIFHFQLGKILLATISQEKLKGMMAKGWPYFSHYSEDMDQCLYNASCQGIRDLVQTLGKLFHTRVFVI